MGAERARSLAGEHPRDRREATRGWEPRRRPLSFAEAIVKYALFVYDAPRSWHSVLTEQRHALHSEYHALVELPGVFAHYRFRPPETTTTVRIEEDHVVKSQGPLVDTSETLRALYLFESDDHDAVLELAARTPAVRMGGAVEVRPILER
jgi:hypothetical protein